LKANTDRKSGPNNLTLKKCEKKNLNKGKHTELNSADAIAPKKTTSGKRSHRVNVLVFP